MRIKDHEHLVEKIIRKHIQGRAEKWDLSVNSYPQVITDLVGVRVLHLFKNDWQSIDGYIRKTWDLQERPVMYHRAGDVPA
jgi:ppGpp synthetase/RelA/SpoT-type nucleotidyltranferase